MHNNKIDIGEIVFQKLKEKERTMVWLLHRQLIIAGHVV